MLIELLVISCKPVLLCRKTFQQKGGVGGGGENVMRTKGKRKGKRNGKKEWKKKLEWKK